MKKSIFKRIYIFVGIGGVFILFWSIFATFTRAQQMIQEEVQKKIYFLKIAEKNLSFEKVKKIFQKEKDILEIKLFPKNSSEEKFLFKKYSLSSLEKGVVIRKKGKIEIYFLFKENILKIVFFSKELEKRIKLLFLRNTIVFLGGMVILFLFLELLFKDIIEPLKSLKKGIEEIKKGNLNIKIKLQGEGEMREIIKSFNEMTQEIRRQKEALEETSTVLEIRVRAKTKALEELSHRLKEEVERKTKTLKEKIEELERMHKIMMKREYRIAELKKELERLKEKLNSQKEKNKI
mgnify:CR=1 FL=1